MILSRIRFVLDPYQNLSEKEGERPVCPRFPRVPAGTRIQVGLAGPNWGRAGGFPQIRLLERIPGENFQPGGPLQQ